ncbi:MAG TPA: 23S rRNA (adenine(2030)-N(6))-methyltransferase RlmJ, partial [Burkholderiaceae bacterium]|nr:23S rRNA (adenine(2030)-N(6))-methyltransferase RlmJ [Burkholderiaceae bacterium]
LDEFNNPRKLGIIAVDLDDGDYLIGAALTDGKHDVMLFSDGGKAVRFDENDVRPTGRNTRGVRGMMLDEGQGVIAMLVAEDEAQSVLTATQNGFGKRTSITEYTRHGRGTKGMIAIQQSGRNGKVVAAIRDAVGRFAEGVYMVWYPIVRRSVSIQLPARLQRLAKKGWLHASLTLGEPDEEGFGMYGSGVFVINPPYTLHATLETALPWLRDALGHAGRTRYLLEHKPV